MTEARNEPRRWPGVTGEPALTHINGKNGPEYYVYQDDDDQAWYVEGPAAPTPEAAVELWNAAVLAKGAADGTAPSGLLETLERYRAALRYYAHGLHFDRGNHADWDTVSGEPANFWCNDAGDTIEDGTLAKLTLQGAQINWTDDGASIPLDAVEGEQEPPCA